ncbi:hypothetical protein K435DRAFT_868821 [Dendrothele bispora CBS 962.96]|uniref:Uncharacterized protein n=1 Tax=Dendrothele bispora (strain CBS 962.96) TaxID=1314807 RepID=A0A4S8LB98_DENBC|nr:hypothetical protein K435DRAFT_868821 [Dendrothele bispora CBS 962.96]
MAYYRTLQSNILHIQHDVLIRHEQVLEASHHGRPETVQVNRNGRCGHPRVEIQPSILAFGYQTRPISQIAHTLNVGQQTVRQRLLDLGIAQPERNPFSQREEELGNRPTEEKTNNSSNKLLDPENVDQQNQSNIESSARSYLSDLTDEQLDRIITSLHNLYPQAGVQMLDGSYGVLDISFPMHEFMMFWIK